MGECASKAEKPEGYYEFLETVSDDMSKSSYKAERQSMQPISGERWNQMNETEAPLMEDAEVTVRQPGAVDASDIDSGARENHTTLGRPRRRSVLDMLMGDEEEAKPYKRIFWAADGLVRSERMSKPHAPIEELREVTKRDRGAVVVASQKLYIIQLRWVARWLLFATRGLETPGPIDNTKLLIDDNSGRFRKSCAFNGETTTGWRAVSEDVWKYLFDLYGGGPAITIQVPEDMHDEKEQQLCKEQQGIIDAARKRLKKEAAERERVAQSSGHIETRNARMQRERKEKHLMDKLLGELRVRQRAKRMVLAKWLKEVTLAADATNHDEVPSGDATVVQQQQAVDA